METNINKKFVVNTNISVALLTILILLHFRPFYFYQDHMNIMRAIHLRMFQLSAFSIIFIYIYRFLFFKSKISKFICTLCIFYSILAVSTIINNGSLNSLISMIYPVLSICMLIEMYMIKNPKLLVNAFAIALGILIYINFFSMIFGIGDPQSWLFMRLRNLLTPLYVLTVTTTYLAIDQKKKNFIVYFYFTLLICTYMVVNAGSGSNIIAWSILMVHFVIKALLKKVEKFEVATHLRSVQKFFKFRIYITFYTLMSVAIIFFNLHMIFGNIIYRFLNRDTTLTRRIFLWDIAKDLIFERPVLGYGVQESSAVISVIDNPKFVGISPNLYYDAHNQFLQTAIVGGLVSIFFVALLVKFAGEKLNKHSNIDLIKVISISIFSVLIVLLTEMWSFLDLFILLAVAFHSEKFIKLE